MPSGRPVRRTSRARSRKDGNGLPQTYDDGGYSGGSLERPALQSLLENIRTGGIDIVVVYKVDRLTRSLGDFAKLVELFDEHKVSFVSVTQSFNTTSLSVIKSFGTFSGEIEWR